MRLLLPLSILFLLSFLVQSPALSSPSPALHGIKEICLIVEEPTSISKNFINSEALKNKIMLKLRQHGIKPISFEPNSEKHPSIALSIRHNALVAGEKPVFAFTWQTRVIRVMYLEPKNTFPGFPATVWDRVNSGIIANSARMNEFEKTVMDQVDEFLNDWYSSNGK